MAKPNIAVLGEPYLPGMLNTPDDLYGWAFVDDVLTRHLAGGSYRFDTLEAYNNHVNRRGYTIYVATGIQGGVSVAGKYLGHDGLIYDDPVNQWYAGKPWMIAAGTFANHVAQFNDHYHMLHQPGTFSTGHDLDHSDESNLRNKVTLWWGRAYAGETFKQLSEWFALPPIVPAGATVDEDWRLVQPTIEAHMQTVCDNCLGFNILRRFHRQCRPIDWNTALNAGLLTAPEFSQEEWAPHAVIRNFTLQSRSRRTELWDELMEWYGKALEWYDNNIKTDITHRLSSDPDPT